jgi:precorrin-6Y C5,15-methyltransferase (decarboxylating)
MVTITGAGPISVVGLLGESFGPGARNALDAATVVVGSQRQLAVIAAPHRGTVEHIELRGPLPALFETIASRADGGQRVCVLASGDPGFFGIVGALSEYFGRQRLVVHPAPSSVALAFARLGLPWDDTTVVSAHGRPLPDAMARMVGPKVAVLTSPDNPPEAIGAALRQAGDVVREVFVLSHLGEAGEVVVQTDVDGLARGTFDPLSVVVLLGHDRPAHAAPLSWGLPESAFSHRNGMITKAEVRAVALGKLALPLTGVLWDIGAGSGSIAVECARLRPALRVIAVEQNAEDAARITENAQRHGAIVEVVCGVAPRSLANLPDPDRVFVGGGGLDALDAALTRLRPGGVAVATYALIERAGDAQKRLGNLIQISVARGVPTGGLGTRLSAENPVFVCWGPEVDDTSWWPLRAAAPPE